MTRKYNPEEDYLTPALKRRMENRAKILPTIERLMPDASYEEKLEANHNLWRFFDGLLEYVLSEKKRKAEEEVKEEVMVKRVLRPVVGGIQKPSIS